MRIASVTAASSLRNSIKSFSEALNGGSDSNRNEVVSSAF